MASLEKRLKELDKLKAKGTITEDEYQTRRAAIIAESAAPAEKPKRGGIFRWGLLGCLGILAVIGGFFVLVIVIVVLALSGATDTHKDVHATLAVGSSGTVTTAADVKNKVTIDAITDPAVSTNQFEQPQAGYHYVTFAVTVENVGERETNGVDVILRTADGFEYDEDYVSGVGASNLNVWQGLTSGGRTNGVLAFEIRDGSTIEWLKFDPNPFAKGDLYFDAQ